MGNQATEVDAKEVSEQEAEAAFNAGMKQVRGDRDQAPKEPESKDDEADDADAVEKEAEKDEGEQDKPADDKADKEAKPVEDKQAKDKGDKAPKDKAAAPAKEEREFAGLKESEWKAIAVKAAQFDDLKASMDKLHDRTAGTLGNMSKVIKDLQNKPAGTGKPLKVVKEQLKRLSVDFPELAERLAEDLSEVLMPESGSAAAKLDPDEVNKIVEAKLADFKFRSDVQQLDTLHPDRKDVIASDAYKVWYGLQSPEAKNAIKTSRDVDFVSSAITAFKTWRDRTAQGSADGAEQAKEAAKKRDKRLDAVMAPTSGTPAESGKRALTPEEEFEAGLKKVRGNRR